MYLFKWLNVFVKIAKHICLQQRLQKLTQALSARPKSDKGTQFYRKGTKKTPENGLATLFACHTECQCQTSAIRNAVWLYIIAEFVKSKPDSEKIQYLRQDLNGDVFWQDSNVIFSCWQSLKNLHHPNLSWNQICWRTVPRNTQFNGIHIRL